MFAPDRRRPWSHPERLAAVLAGAVFLVVLYRAVTQSFTIDESFAFNRVWTTTWAEEFTTFWDNHHVLHSYLTKACMHLFGPSEPSLRLPSLLGCGLYLAAAVLMARRLFSKRWLAPLAVALLALDANVLDFMSAARGYGLGLAFLAISLLAMLHAIDPDEPPRSVGRWLAGAGAALGLAAASNLAYVLPGLGFSLALSLVLLAAAPPGERAPALLRWLLWFAAPGMALFGGVAGSVLVHMRPSDFYVGARSIPHFMEWLCTATFRRPILHLIHWSPTVYLVFDTLVALALASTAAALLLRVLRVGPHAQDHAAPASERGLRLIGGGLLLACILLIVANHTLAIRYPGERMALWFLPAVYLSVLCLVDASWPDRAWRLATTPLLCACALPLVGDLAAFDVTYYGPWGFDRSTKRYAALIAERHQAVGEGTVVVCPTWTIEPTMNYYRTTREMSWLVPVDRGGTKRRCDYYILVGNDRARVEEMGLIVLAQDELARTILAAQPRVDAAP